MEIILRQTIDTLGRAGQVVKVADGYARNFLLPRKLALLVTPPWEGGDGRASNEPPRTKRKADAGIEAKAGVRS